MLVKSSTYISLTFQVSFVNFLNVVSDIFCSLCIPSTSASAVQSQVQVQVHRGYVRCKLQLPTKQMLSISRDYSAARTCFSGFFFPSKRSTRATIMLHENGSDKLTKRGLVCELFTAFLTAHLSRVLRPFTESLSGRRCFPAFFLFSSAGSRVFIFFAY